MDLKSKMVDVNEKKETIMKKYTYIPASLGKQRGWFHCPILKIYAV
jgi:hypothetical protein